MGHPDRKTLTDRRKEAWQTIGWTALLGYFFLYLTRGLHAPWFSSHLTLRYQTEAFFKGDLSIQDHPYFVEADWGWGQGMQQLWGLGVPLLRFPFEALGRLFGQPAFPDAMVFIFLYLVVTYLFVNFFFSEAQYELKFFFPAVLMLFPSLICLTASRFQVYEEVVAYHILWAYLDVVLLFRFWASPTKTRLCLLAAVAGFTPVIRPTGIFYGASAFILGLVLAYKKGLGWKENVAAILLFLLGPVFVLMTNNIRFGSPFEFGYSGNLSGVIPNLFALRMGYPFANESLFSAGKELIAALFLSTKLSGANFYLEQIHPWFSATIRFRELYLLPFGPFILGVLMISWVPLIKEKKDSWRKWGYCWSAICFTGLFIFYLRSPSLTSRYIADFTPAIAVMLVVFFSSLVKYTGQSKVSMVMVVIVCLLAGRAISEGRKAIRGAYQWKAQTVRDEVEIRLIGRVAKQTVAKKLSLPNRYDCQPEDRHEIAVNRIGWGPACGVDSISMVFLPPSRCVEMAFSRPTVSSNIEPIQVKSGFEFLKLKSLELSGGKEQAVFCSEEPLQSAQPQMISIGWLKPADLRPGKVEGYKLHSIRIFSDKP